MEMETRYWLTGTLHTIAEDFRRLRKAYEEGREAGLEVDGLTHARALQLLEKGKQLLDAVINTPEIMPENIPF